MSICGYHSPRFSEVNAPLPLPPSLPPWSLLPFSLARSNGWVLVVFSSRARWEPRGASVSKNFPVLSFFSPGYCLAPPMASTVWHADGWRPPEYHYRRFVAFLSGALLISGTNWLGICWLWAIILITEDLNQCQRCFIWLDITYWNPVWIPPPFAIWCLGLFLELQNCAFVGSPWQERQDCQNATGGYSGFILHLSGDEDTVASSPVSSNVRITSCLFQSHLSIKIQPWYCCQNVTRNLQSQSRINNILFFWDNTVVCY